MPQFVMTGRETPAFRALDSFTQGYIEALFFTEEESLCEEGEGREMPSVVIDRATMESRFEGGNSYGAADLAPCALASIIADCAAFQARGEWTSLHDDFVCRDGFHPAERKMTNNGETDFDTKAGRDFWYTRNGHGCGFWDGDWPEPHATALSNAAASFRSVDVHIGDDGKVYLS